MARRERIEEGGVIELPRPLPTREHIAEVLQSYIDAGWTWRGIAAGCDVHDRTLRKMHAQENVIYRNVEAFWSFHVVQMEAMAPDE